MVHSGPENTGLRTAQHIHSGIMTGASGEAFMCSGDRYSLVSDITGVSARAASGFLAMGIGEGDTVALFLRNDFAFFEASVGAKMAGAFPVPINWHSTAEEAAYILNDCQAKAIVVHEDMLPRIESGLPAGLQVLVVPTPPEIRAAYNVTEWATPAVPVRGWYDWLAPYPELENPADTTRFAVIYTSGTTGHPKGVKRVFTQTPDISKRLLPYCLDTEGPMTILMNGPMYHSAPNAYSSLAYAVGANIILQPRFDAEEMLTLIEQHRITHMHIVPTMFVRLLKLPQEIREKYNLSSLRSVIHGAAPCPREVKKAMIEWWGPVINEYYGSTETGLVVGNNSENALLKPGTVGRALPNSVVKIFDEAGNELGPGEVGDVYVRSWNNPDFTYIGDEEKRRNAGRGDLITVGDMGYLDEDGFLFLVDRRRDMIISGGVNIYPAEIEASLVTINGVRDCAVFGIPDEEYGEAICAYVEPMPSASLDADTIRSELEKRISRFKIPGLIKIVDTLPREDSGKIFKRKLREPYWAAKGRSI